MDRVVVEKINKLFKLPPLRYVKKASGGFLSDNYILSDGTVF